MTVVVAYKTQLWGQKFVFLHILDISHFNCNIPNINYAFNEESSVNATKTTFWKLQVINHQ